MPPPTVLKKRHSLLGKNILPIVKKLRDSNLAISNYARFRMNVPLEGMADDEIINSFRELTGESEKECIEMAGKDVSADTLRALAHFSIIHANEYGQPSGKSLLEEDKTVDQETTTPPLKKLKADSSIEKRLKDLEEKQKREENTEVDNIKTKVRSLAMQASPSIPLLLASLDELSRVARRHEHEETSLFEELARQANYNADKIDVPAFCLNVLGGKATDIVGKALTKALKSNTTDNEQKSNQPKSNDLHAPSPLMGLYQQQFPMPPYGYMPPQYLHQPYGYGPRKYQRGAARSPHGKGCLFCGSTSHYFRDCEKMKAARGKQ